MKKLIPVLVLVACAYIGSANAYEVVPVSDHMTIADRAINTLDNMASNFESQAAVATEAGNHELAKTYSDQAVYIRIQALRMLRAKQNAENN